MSKLLSSLPVGTKVVDKDTKYYGSPIVWLVGGHDHYAPGQTVMISEKIITLKTFDAKEPTNTNANRRANGNNRYLYSNIRAWLNSNNNQWYTQTHSYDSPPTNANVDGGYNEFDTEPGFLTNLGPTLRSSLKTAELIVARNEVDGGLSEIVIDKVFLLSNTEVGLKNVNNIAEGKLLPLFTTSNSSRLAYPTAESVSNSEYKSSIIKPESAITWWLRTAVTASTSASFNKSVHTSGSEDQNYAYRGYTGIRPAINLTSEMLVSDSVNANGEYEIVPAHITPDDKTNLGNISDKSSILKYTPKLYVNGTTVTEKINGVVVGTKTIVNDTEYTVSATAAQWNAVKYGKYKDTVGNRNAVTLEISTGETYTYPFAKTLPTTAKTNDVLVASNDMANVAMPSHKKKLVDAIGNKATIGGTGSLEDIAKAVESISIESMRGIRYAVGSFTTILDGSYSDATVLGLAFTPKAIVIVSGGSMSGVFFPKDYRGLYAQSSMNIDILRGSTTSSHSQLSFKPLENGFNVYASSSYLLVNQTYGYIVFD